jgi:hypothetical protein
MVWAPMTGIDDAIFENEFYVATRNYLFQFDATTWGWIHLVMGLVVAFAGWGLLSGLTWARAAAITLTLPGRSMSAISATSAATEVRSRPGWGGRPAVAGPVVRHPADAEPVGGGGAAAPAARRGWVSRAARRPPAGPGLCARRPSRTHGRCARRAASDRSRSPPGERSDRARSLSLRRCGMVAVGPTGEAR